VDGNTENLKGQHNEQGCVNSEIIGKKKESSNEARAFFIKVLLITSSTSIMHFKPTKIKTNPPWTMRILPWTSSEG
jgi:hypothetical protein